MLETPALTCPTPLRPFNPGLPTWPERQRPLVVWLSALVLILLAGIASAQDNRPGATNPIQTPDQRTLFADHGALVWDTTGVGLWERNKQGSSLEKIRKIDWPLPPIAKLSTGQIWLRPSGIEDIATASYDRDKRRLFVKPYLDGRWPIWKVEHYLDSWPRKWSYTDFSDGWFSFDMDVGELEPRVDSSGEGHDEVVVCYQGKQSGQDQGKDSWSLTVLDYTDVDPQDSTTWDRTTVTTTDSLRVDQSPEWSTLYPGDRVACAGADIDGDGVDEVVLAYVKVAGFNDRGSVQVEVFDYTNNREQGTTLKQVSTLNFGPVGNRAAPNPDKPRIAGSIDIATGDYNGNGRDEIAIAVAEWQGLSDSTIGEAASVSFSPSVHILASDSKGSTQLTRQSTHVVSDGLKRTSRIQIASGLFIFDPDGATGFNFNRRQLALVFNLDDRSNTRLQAQFFSVSDDLRSIEQITGANLPLQDDTRGLLAPHRFSIAAGNFSGAVDINNPLWSLVISHWETTTSNSSATETGGPTTLHWLKLSPDKELTLQSRLTSSGLKDDDQFLMPVTAWDAMGRSLQLGSPLHIAVDQLTTTQHVTQEPPKHAYWWPPSAIKASDGQIINVSRYPAFNVELRDSKNISYSTEHKSKTDWTVGGSTELTSKATAGFGEGIEGVAKAEASMTLEGTIKAGYSYNEKADDFEKSFLKQTITTEAATDADDFIRYQASSLDIWRYPIAGIELDNGLNPFYEFVIPAADRPQTRSIGGLSADWYQPLHENGNLLSYPALDSRFRPQDCCAEFKLVTDEGASAKRIPFFDNHVESVGGTSGTIGLQFSETAGSGSSKAWTHKLTGSVDVTTSAKVVGSFPGGKAEISGGLTLSTKGDTSWGDLDTASSETNNMSGFKLSKPAIDFNQSYNFAPVFYVAENGTTRVTHAVDVESSVGSFWRDVYGQKPDPALNLPRRFSVFGSKLTVNERADAKKIRGFFVRRAEQSENGDYPLLAGAAKDGDRVRLEVRVYNYAISKRFTNMGIAFEAVQYDKASNTEVGERRQIDCGVGSDTSTTLNPREHRLAVCVWDTTGFGPTAPGAIQDYRVYVTLDPENQIDELYEGTLGPGQNNEGWGQVALASPEARRGSLSLTPTASSAEGADVHAQADALSLYLDGEHLSSDLTTIEHRVSAPLRFCADTDQLLTGDQHVLIWSGHPDDGGRLVAHKLLHGMEPGGGNCVWLEDFRFDESDEHSLYAEVLEASDDGLRGNAVDTLAISMADSFAPVVVSAEGWARPEPTRRVHRRAFMHLRVGFALDYEVDLQRSKLIVESLLDELGGAGELLDSVTGVTGDNLVLSPWVALPNRAGYRFRVPVRDNSEETVEIRVSLQLDGRMLDLTLEVRADDIREPRLCAGTTDLKTAFRLLDRIGRPIPLNLTAPWQCQLNRVGGLNALILDE